MTGHTKPSQELAYLALASQNSTLLPLVNAYCESSVLESLASMCPPGMHVSAQHPGGTGMVSDKHHLLGSILLQNGWMAVSQAALCSCHKGVTAQLDSAWGPGAPVLRWLAQQVGLQTQCITTLYSLYAALVSSSLPQMCRAHDIATAALCVSVTPANCLTLMTAASTAGADSVYRAARACALDHFTSYVTTRRSELNRLSLETLVSLLSDDDLQASEHDVFLALLGWYQHKSGAQQPSSDAGPSQRSPAPQQPQQPQQLAASEPLRPLDQLAKQCVRAHLLTMKELEALDAHPEVSANDAALRLVAGWYISSIYGVPMDCGAAAATAAALAAPAGAAGTASPGAASRQPRKRRGLNSR